MMSNDSANATRRSRRQARREQRRTTIEPDDNLSQNTARQCIILPWESPKWDNIKQHLTSPISNLADMDNRLVMMHNGKLKSRIIIDLINKYLSDTTIMDQYDITQIETCIFPLLRELILEGKKIFHGTKLHVLTAGTCNITLTRLQIACLMACSWFGLFSFHGASYLSAGEARLRNFSKFSLVDLFLSGNVHSLQCILRYFMVIHEARNSARDDFESGIIIYHRRNLTKDLTPDFAHSEKPLTEVNIGGPIDAFPEHIFKVNFSTEYIVENCFQGMLNYEEIMFLTHPECIPATLLVSHLGDMDSLIILGADKMATLNGFGSNVRYDGHYTADGKKYGVDKRSVGMRGRASADQLQDKLLLKSAIICIDASKSFDAHSQLIDNFDRDLLKAYCGFSAFSFEDPTIMTGHWSPVMFSGNTQLKFLQQLIAASECGKNIVYYITSRDFETQIDDFIKFIYEEDLVVGELYVMYKQLLLNCMRKKIRLNDLNIFEAIMEMPIPDI